jgi:hypothetical protein
MENKYHYPSQEEIRCSFLSEKDIEDEGWTQLHDLSPFTGKRYKYVKHKEVHFNEPHTWTLECDNPEWGIKIHHKWESSWNRVSEYIYIGKCPDINTFRTICKLVGV